MTVRELFYKIRNINILISNSDIFSLISFILKIDNNKILMTFENEVSSEIEEALPDIFNSLANNFPIPYLIKSREFYGYDFFVDERVLIPRFETEVLVENALKYLKDGDTILDLCTGSGCILLTLLMENCTLNGVGVDISYDALSVAKMNINKFNLQDRASLICCDVMGENFIKKSEFNIITCNPPYVGINEETGESTKYEPSIAIYSGIDRLKFYKKMLKMLDKLCKKDGVILFEVGYGVSEELKDIYYDKKIHFIRDLSGIERVMVWRN